jgi:hypothetical protein
MSMNSWCNLGFSLLHQLQTQRKGDEIHLEPNILWSALERTNGFVMHYSDDMNLKGSIVQLLT